ncbi:MULTISPECIES: hypothetical protein [Comamonas]|uniref:hypothetical protein n=1 Tax=Comamonas TaxID=283 RepID=UPI0024E0A518|nr:MULTISPECIES: hypothetical protein [Comamonas]
MDSRTLQKQQGAAVNEGDVLLMIKTAMPQTYQAIQRKAGQFGNDVYRLVRLGIRGQANCFYAWEGGRVVGTPFASTHPVMAVVAQGLVQFGCAHVCIIAEPAKAEG